MDPKDLVTSVKAITGSKAERVLPLEHTAVSEQHVAMDSQVSLATRL